MYNLINYKKKKNETRKNTYDKEFSEGAIQC